MLAALFYMIETYEEFLFKQQKEAHKEQNERLHAINKERKEQLRDDLGSDFSSEATSHMTEFVEIELNTESTIMIM